MRELDNETVVWPAWCYSGEITSDTSPQTASSPSLQISPTTQAMAASANGNSENNNNSNNFNKNRTKRKPIHNPLQYSVDKMLNERNKLTTSLIETNNKKLFNNSGNNNTINNNNNNNNINNNNYNSNLVISNGNNSSNNLYYDKMKNDNNMNFIKNGQLSPTTATKLSGVTLTKCLSNGTNGNNSNGSSNKTNGNTINGGIKTERLSPTLNDLSVYRSRSVTPSSFSGTPPQQSNQPNNLINPNINQMLPVTLSHLGSHSSSNIRDSNSNSNNNNNNNNNTNNHRSDLQPPPLNYSDMMRSLAAKYNNSNDLPTPKNSFIEPRTKSREPNVPAIDKKPSAMSPPQVPNPNLLTSLFSSLQFSQNSIFNPMLDMGSTRALVLLARAAQEAEMQKLLKEQDKPAPKLPSTNSSFMSSIPSTSAQISNLSNFGNFNPFPALSNLQALHQLSTRSPPAPSVTQSSFKSPPRENNSGISPLDLSSSSTPPMAKRIKLSPTSSDSIQRQQPTPPNVTTTNQQLNATTTTFSGSSSSSTTSNTSEQSPSQPIQQQPAKCQTKINEINSWNVEQVCDFVDSIDICVEYVNNFRQQSIDGEGLTMLTEEHLINILGMKLGPVLKLRSKLGRKMNGPCECGSCATAVVACSDGSITETTTFINNFPKMIIPRAGSADSIS